MCKNTTVRTLTLRALALASGLATAAHATDNCDVFRPGLPDFDQKRAVGLRPQPPHRPGLPGNGSMYCIPTSAINRMGFIANNGWPSMMGGPRHWSQDANYEFVTEQIREMGELMNTHAENGTGGTGWFDGVKAWLNQRAPGRFIVGQYGVVDGKGPSPAQLRALLDLGALVDICYGRFSPEEDNPGVLKRSGGHACTLRHVYNACSTPEVALRNPSNSSSLVTQAPFDLAKSEMRLRIGDFRTGGGEVQERTYWEFDDFNNGSNPPFRLLDGVNFILPLFALSSSPIAGEEAAIHNTRPLDFTDSPHPTHNIFRLDAFAAVQDVQLHPVSVLAWARVSGSSATGGARPHVKVFDGSTGATAATFELSTGNGPIACGRDGDLYVVDGNILRQLRLRDGRIDSIGTRTLPSVPGAIAFDDSADQVVLIHGGQSSHQVVRLGRNIATSAQTTHSLPPGIVPCTELTFTIDDEGRLLLGCSSDIFFVGSNPSGGLSIVDQVRLDGGVQVRSVQATDTGGIMFVDRGIVRELVRTRTGWAPNPDSMFDGMTSGPIFRIARSRSYFDITDAEPGPRQSPEDDLPAVGECTADFNEDGGIDGADVEAFYAAWEAAEENADVNFDGGVDGADVEAFFAAWESGAC